MVSQKMNYFMNYKRERGKSKINILLHSFYSTEVKQISCTLCMFDARFKNIKNLSPCLLFAYVGGKAGNRKESNGISGDNSNESLSDKHFIHCIICHEQFTIDFMDLHLKSLKRHLNDQHFGLGNLVKDSYKTLGNIIQGVDLVQMENISYSYTPAIESFFKKKEKNNVEQISDNSESSKIIEVVVDESGKIIVPIPEDKVLYMKRILLMIIFQLSLTINQKLTDYEDFLQSVLHFKLPCRNTVVKYLPDMCSSIKQVLKRYLVDKKGYSFACDGWSVVKPYVSLESYFICIYHHNKYQSFLLDCKHFESSTANNLIAGLKDIQKEFNKQEPSVVTCDGAKNNEKAFADHRITCNCHAIDLVLKHFAECNSKYEFTADEKEKISNFYSFMDKITNSLQFKAGRNFQAWVKSFSSLNIDFDDNVCLPEVVSPTRWIGIAIKLKWFYNYGMLHWRYVVYTESSINEESKENLSKKRGRKKKMTKPHLIVHGETMVIF